MGGPFDLLGLPRDADERAVKRAYAAKLKLTRPDDDPAGFARLVAARDEAMIYVRNGWRYGSWDESEDDEDDRDDGAGTPEAAAAEAAVRPEPAEASSATSGNDELAGETGAPHPLVRSAGGGEADVPEPAERMPPVTGEAPPREPAGTPPPPDPVTGEGANDLPAPAPFVDPQAPSLEALTGRMEALLGGRQALDRWRWDDLLRASELLDLVTRRRFEERLAVALNRALPYHMGHSGEPDPLDLVEHIAAGFDWTDNPRRVAGFVGAGESRSPLLEQLDRSARRIRPAPEDGNRVAWIDPFDLTGHFGSAGHRTVQYYHSARALGRYPLSWDWWALVNPAVWLVKSGWYLAAFPLCLLAVWQFGMMQGLPGDVLIPVQAAVTGAAAALHFGLALWSDRLLLARLRRIARRADKVSAFRDAARRKVLAAAGESNVIVAGFAGLLFFVCVDQPAFIRFETVGRTVTTTWQAGRLPTAADVTQAMSAPFLEVRRRKAQASVAAAVAASEDLRAAGSPQRLAALVAGRVNTALAAATPEMLTAYERDPQPLIAGIARTPAAQFRVLMGLLASKSPLMAEFLDRNPWLAPADLQRLAAKAVGGLLLLDPNDFGAALEDPETFVSHFISQALAASGDLRLLERSGAVTCPLRPDRNAFGIPYPGGLGGAVGGLMERDLAARMARFDDAARSAFAANPAPTIAAACTAFLQRLQTASEAFTSTDWLPEPLAAPGAQAKADALRGAVARSIRLMSADELDRLLAAPMPALKDAAAQVR